MQLTLLAMVARCHMNASVKLMQRGGVEEVERTCVSWMTYARGTY
jgi:hypothetical protein